MEKAIMQAMEEALWERLFRKETNLFYDFVSSYDAASALDHLPYPDEIAHQVPNPCGWGTGMEDSMLNGGAMLDILCMRGEKEEKKRASRVFQGLRLSATVHGKRGFIARSISPRDGRSCYINSSRDQYTLFVYGIWKYFHSSLSSEKEKEQIRDLLSGIAEFCEKETMLLRLDGAPGLVCRLTGEIGLHEVMRLPMFFAAAWDVTRNPHWFDLYRHFAHPGIQKNLEFSSKKNWWYMELNQMVVSLLLIASFDSELAPLCRNILAMAAGQAEKMLAAHREYWKNIHLDTSALPGDWRSAPFHLRMSDPEMTGALYHGYPYYCPQLNPEFRRVQEKLRELGQVAFVLFSIQKTSEWTEYFFQEVSQIDFSAHATYAPMNLLHAWTALNTKSGIHP